MRIYVNETPFYVLFKALMPSCMEIYAQKSVFQSNLVDFWKNTWIYNKLHNNKIVGIVEFWKAHFSIRVRSRTGLSNPKRDFRIFHFLTIFGQNLIKFWGNLGKIGKKWHYFAQKSAKIWKFKKSFLGLYKQFLELTLVQKSSFQNSSMPKYLFLCDFLCIHAFFPKSTKFDWKTEILA